ncbi:hypothetical protein FOA52_015475 [Chlamydomonas sp. UWO 241]|nr:hypothetical protein FOA52_015475 [Chlamydomonas sp. UWO 241]
MRPPPPLPHSSSVVIAWAALIQRTLPQECSASLADSSDGDESGGESSPCDARAEQALARLRALIVPDPPPESPAGSAPALGPPPLSVCPSGDANPLFELGLPTRPLSCVVCRAMAVWAATQAFPYPSVLAVRPAFLAEVAAYWAAKEKLSGQMEELRTLMLALVPPAAIPRPMQAGLRGGTGVAAHDSHPRSHTLPIARPHKCGGECDSDGGHDSSDNDGESSSSSRDGDSGGCSVDGGGSGGDGGDRTRGEAPPAALGPLAALLSSVLADPVRVYVLLGGAAYMQCKS